MPLPSSGAISLNDMHIEAGGSSGTQVSLNDSDIRDMISKGSGVQMSFSEWYGASSGPFIEGGGDVSFWNAGFENTLQSAMPSGIKAYWYEIGGAGWGLEELTVTPEGWDNGNGWGTGIPNATINIYAGGSNTQVSVPFDPTDATWGNTVYGRSICDWFSYSHMHGGGSYAQSTREPNHSTPNFDPNLPNGTPHPGGYTNTVQSVAQTDYPYYAVGGWYYCFQVGDVGVFLDGGNYGGYALEPYRTDSPTYPF